MTTEHDTELDHSIGAAMKTLDDQVPSGYFDGLSARVMSRLAQPEEDMSMQTTRSTDHADHNLAVSMDMNPADEPRAASESDQPEGERADAVPRDEDSGLHDIRNLAQSTKQRLSKQISVPRTQTDDDLIASSSSGWKAVALPEPAKMISLPELAALPTKAEIKAREKEAKVSKAEAKRASKEHIAVVPAPSDEPATAAAVDAPVEAKPAATKKAAAVAATPSASQPMLGARLAQPQGKSKGPLYGGIGLGLAAAAGLVYVVGFRDSGKAAPKPTQIAVAPIEDVKPVEPPPVETRAAEPPKAEEQAVVPAVEPKPPEVAAPGAVDTAKAAPKSKQAVTKGTTEKPEAVPAKDAKADAKKAGSGSAEAPKEGDPSFDDLLNEAGYKGPKVEKPKLDKKSLTGDDFKKGMAPVESKAKGCYAGKQGTATVKLTISPDGKVSKVAVTGEFAGTPVGNCVAGAVRGAAFAPWDGGPQTFGYSYLLSE